MANDDSALVEFETNIEAVVQRIRSGLKTLEGLSVKGQTKGNADDFIGDIDVSTRQAVRDIDSFVNAMRRSEISAEQAATGIRDSFRSVERQVGALSRQRGLTLDVALKLSKNTLGELTPEVNRALQTVSADAGRKVRGTGAISSTDKSFTSAFNDTSTEARNYNARSAAAAKRTVESQEAEASATQQAARSAQENAEAQKTKAGKSKKAATNQAAAQTDEGDFDLEANRVKPKSRSRAKKPTPQELEEREANLQEIYPGGGPDRAKHIAKIGANSFLNLNTDALYQIDQHPGARQVRPGDPGYDRTRSMANEHLTRAANQQQAQAEAGAQKQGILETRASKEDTQRQAQADAGAQKQGILEERAQREDTQRAAQADAQAQKQGILETRASREDAQRAAQADAQAQKQGILETRAQREDAQRQTQADAQSQKQGILETRAQREDAQRQAQADAQSQKQGILETRASREDAQRQAQADAQAQKQGILETRASREDAQRQTQADAQAQKQGILETRASREDAQRQTQADAQAQKQGILETQASREDTRRAAQADAQAQKQGILETRASREDAQRAAQADAQAQKRGALETRRAHADSIFDALNNGDTGVTDLRNGYFKDIRSGTARYFKLVADGLKELGSDVPGEIHKAQQAEHQLMQRNTKKGFLGSFLSGVSTVGLGNDNKSGLDVDALGKSAGITAKYAVLGQTFFAIQTAIAAAGQELLDFEDSMTELDVAMESTGKHADQFFVRDLSDTAAKAGSNVGEAMDVAASGIRAFRDELDPSEIEHFGVAFANEAQKIALLTKTDLADAAGNLKAITLAFDIDPQNIARIKDVLVGAKNLGGGDEKEVGQGLANLGTAFKEIGFTAEETGAIISKIQAQTDEGGTLIASRLSRVASIIGGSPAKNAIRALNQTLNPDQRIDLSATATVKDQVLQLGAVYNQISQAQRQQLVNSLGGTANARELIILLQNVNELTHEADKGFEGQGAKEYERRLNDLRATLTQIKGAIKGIVTSLAESGILDPFAILLKEGVLPLLTGVRQLLQLFNLIPRPLRTAAGVAAALYATLKLISALKTADGLSGLLRNVEGAVDPLRAEARDRRRPRKSSGIADAVAGADALFDGEEDGPRRQRRKAFGIIPQNFDFSESARRRAQARLERQMAAERFPGLTQKALADLTPAERHLPTLTRAGEGLKAGGRTAITGIKSGSKALGEVINPAEALAIGGGIAIQQTYEATKKIIDAVKEFDKLRTLPTNFGVNELRESAKNIRSAADELKHSSDGFFGTISNFAQGNPAGPKTKDAEEQARLQEKSAARLAGARKEANVTSPDDLGAQLDFSGTDALRASLDALSQSGATASDVTDAFIGRLDQMASHAEGAGDKLTAFQQTQVTEATGTTLENLAVQFRDEARDRPVAARRRGRGDGVGANAPGSDLSKLSIEKFGNTTRDVVKQFLSDGGDVSSIEGRKALSQLLENNFRRALPDKKDRQQAVSLALNTVKAESDKQTSSFLDGMTPQQIAAFIPQLASDKAANITALASVSTPGADHTADTADLQGAKSKADTFQKGIDALKRQRKAAENQKLPDNLVSPSGAVSPQMLKNFQQQQQKKIAEIDEQLKGATEGQKQATGEVAQATLSNVQSLAALNAASIPDENTTAKLKATLDTLKKQHNVSGLKDEQYRDIEAQQIVTQRQAQLSALADAQAAATTQIDPRDSVAKQGRALTSAKQTRDLYKSLGIQGKALSDAEQAVIDARVALNDSQFQRAQANINATATEESPLSQARAAMEAAKASYDRLNSNEDGYIEAQTAYFAAQRAFTRAQTEAANVTARLAIDLSNPVQVAQTELENARRKLSDVRSSVNKNPKLSPLERAEAIGNAELAVRSADLQHQQAGFNQWLSDLETSKRLNRISNQSYLEHLRQRRDSIGLELAAMKDRGNGYRQLKDQYNQLSESLKSAADEMSGQFNLGDIKVPSVYQIRRAIAAKDGGGDILRANSPFSTAGNVTHDTSTKNVILNGVPVQQIMTMIENLFGVKARTTAGRRAP